MNKDTCEVCWESEANLYRYGGSIYCEQDLERAINEEWHNKTSKIKEIIK